MGPFHPEMVGGGFRDGLRRLCIWYSTDKGRQERGQPPERWTDNGMQYGWHLFYYKLLAERQGSHYILVLKFKDFQGPWSCIFKDQFSTEVYSMDSITAIFNIYFCYYGTVLVDKNKTWQLLANIVLGKTPV